MVCVCDSNLRKFLVEISNAVGLDKLDYDFMSISGFIKILFSWIGLEFFETFVQWVIVRTEVSRSHTIKQLFNKPLLHIMIKLKEPV